MWNGWNGDGTGSLLALADGRYMCDGVMGGGKIFSGADDGG